MCKTYAQAAMDVIKDDWEERKVVNPRKYTQEKVSEIMGISRAQFAKALLYPKDPTITFICTYAAAVEMPVTDLLAKIGEEVTELERQQRFLIMRQMKKVPQEE